VSVPKFHSIELPRPRQHVIVEMWLKLHAGTVTLARIRATCAERWLEVVLQHLLYDDVWREFYKRAEHQEEFNMPWHNPPHMHKPDPREVYMQVNGVTEYTLSANSFDGSQSSLTDWSTIELGAEPPPKAP